ncbi:hypothetical protein [Methylobacterium dankookense]|uniref:Uncharacterized protein n=1 Tax=Methylobacterium dankookense TaxID=560405 RepID=A0A564FX04_9HYPH|nr:hypothetical protein [Methylobacterium dankookense]GJD56415.1 hypothetical protein IFDJLNFL_2311 [Methylobacterium dankookense]VUF12532.1 hypothetical protein MTDSW087_02224 [Methylobacterium dankookense]
MSQIYTDGRPNSANSPEHRRGQSVDSIDQTGSVTMLGLAAAGAAAASLLLLAIV